MALLSSTGSIGTSGANIQTAATNLSANTGGSGNVYLNQSGLVNPDIIVGGSAVPVDG